MADFISDEEMAKLESKQSKDFISDEEMNALEKQPSSEQQSSDPSVFRSFGEGLTMGFSGETAGAVEALAGLGQGLITGSNNFGDEGRLAAIKSFADNYAKGRDTYDAQRQLAASISPWKALGAELGGAAVTGSAGASALGAKGLGLVAQGAAQGGLAGLGKSNKESVGEAVKDTAEGATLGALFSWGINKLLGGKGTDVIKKAKDGSFDVKVGQNAKDVFKISRETAQNLATPEAQNALRSELNAQAAGLKTSIAADFKSTEALKQAALQEKGAIPAKGLQKALDDAWENINNIKPENDEAAMKALEGLKQRFKDVNMQLLTKSPDGVIDNIPLAALEKTRSELGDIIFAQKAYNKIPQVKSAATKLWGKLTDVLVKNDLDPLTKQSGNLTKALAGQRALFKIADEVDSLPSGDWIKALANPSSSSGLERFQNMVKPLEDLAKKGQDYVIPNISSYISNDFNSAVMRARVSNMILGETGQAGKISPKQALSSLISGYKYGSAAKAGAALGSLDKLKLLNMPIGRAATLPLDAGVSGVQAVAPYLGSSLTNLGQGTKE